MTVASRADAADTADEPPCPAAVDVAVFDALLAGLGDPGLRHELLAVYLLQSGPQIAELVAAAGQADQPTVRRLAHLMGSSSALLGAVGQPASSVGPRRPRGRDPWTISAPWRVALSANTPGWKPT